MDRLALDAIETVSDADTSTLTSATAIVTATATAITKLAHKPCHGMGHGMDHEMHHGAMMSPTNAMPGMDHDMPGHDMPGMKMCKMSMTLNGDYENLCILTDKLMVSSVPQLIMAMAGIALFTFGYEYFKMFCRKMEGRYAQYLSSNTVTENERKKYRLRLSTAYAFSVGYSFIIMLLFMTFNVWIMLAVCIGAGVGHYLLELSCPAVNLTCH